MPGDQIFDQITGEEAAGQKLAEHALFALAEHMQTQHGVPPAIMMGALTHVLCSGLISSFGTNGEIIDHMNKILPSALNEVRSIYDIPEPRTN
jgi:hypothetical protein